MSATRQFGIVLIVFGALLLIGAAFAYAYQETQSYSILGITSIPITTTPYRDDTLPLILGSVALFVLGFALLVYRPQNSPPPPKS